MISRTLLGIWFVAALPDSAGAALLTGSTPGFHHFYKQGATMEEHDAALVDCAVRTRAMVNGSDAMTAMSAATGGGLVGALIGGIIDSNENRQGAAANTEGCMAIKGWSVVALTEDEGKLMEQPDESAAIHEKLKPYVEAASARGPVLRGPYANELFAGNFIVEKARDLEEVSISVRAVKDKREAAVTAAGELKPPKPPKLPDGVKAPKPAKAYKEADLPAAIAEQSHLVMRISYSKGPFGLFDVMLHRLGKDGSEVAYDGAIAVAKTSTAKTGKGEKSGLKYIDYVIPVPPGVWKIETITAYPYAADLCFGAPAFAIGQGDTVFVGEMTIRETGGYPLTADLAVAKEILAANPALAEKVKPAEWTNGYTSDCFGSYVYAYEIPNAPYVDLEALARSAAAAPDSAPPVEEASPSADDASDTIASEQSADE